MPVPDFILDVRSPDEYEEEHLEGAVNIPLDAEDGALCDRLQDLPAPDEGRRIVVFCRGGLRAARAVHFLRENGWRSACVGHKGYAGSCGAPFGALPPAASSSTPPALSSPLASPAAVLSDVAAEPGVHPVAALLVSVGFGLVGLAMSWRTHKKVEGLERMIGDEQVLKRLGGA